jgi:hypothetical protein
MNRIVLVFCLLGAPAFAAPTGFAGRAPYPGGAAVIELAEGGEYVYARQQVDNRIRTRPVLATPPERQTWVFFAAEEEQALLRYRDGQLAALARERLTPAHRPHGRATVTLKWPKVIVRAGEICVPGLASSAAADWRAHLVCHATGATR